MLQLPVYARLYNEGPHRALGKYLPVRSVVFYSCLILLGGLSPFEVFYGRQSNAVKHPLKLGASEDDSVVLSSEDDMSDLEDAASLQEESPKWVYVTRHNDI